MQQSFPEAQPRVSRGARARHARGQKKCRALARGDRLDDRRRHRARNARPPSLRCRVARAHDDQSRATERAQRRRCARCRTRGSRRRRTTPASGARPQSRSPMSPLLPVRILVHRLGSRRTRARATTVVVREALAHLRASVAAEPGHVDVSERLVRLAAITGDWPRARTRLALLLCGRASRAERAARARRGVSFGTSRWWREGRCVSGAMRRMRFAALVDSKLFEPAALIVSCGALSTRAPECRDARDRRLRALPARCETHHELLLSRCCARAQETRRRGAHNSSLRERRFGRASTGAGARADPMIRQHSGQSSKSAST